MNYQVVIWIILACVLALVLGIVTFYFLMKRNKINVKRDFPDCPLLLAKRYTLWYNSFAIWTSVDVFLIILPIITSISTIYFSSDILLNNDNKTSVIFLAILSYLSTLLPVIKSKLLPKRRARCFYKSAATFEVALLKHKERLITTEQLIDVGAISERISSRVNNK